MFAGNKEQVLISSRYLTLFKINKFSISIPLIFFLFLIIGSSTVAFSQEWDLREDVPGIKIYTRDFPGSNFKEIKAEVSVKSTLAGVTKFFNDITLFTKWMYACITAYELKKVSATDGYVYTVIAANWPVRDRDAITHYVWTQDPETKIILITLTGVKDYIAEQPGIVRTESLTGTTQIVPEKDGMVKIIYLLHIDPGGSLPGWLANFFVTSGPLKSFQKLVELLSQKEYSTYKDKDILEP